MVITVGGAGRHVSQRVFLRATDERDYREVLPPDEKTRFTDIVSPEHTPVVFISGETDPPNTLFPIFSVSLPDAQLAICSPPIATPGTEVWVSQLVAASGDGTFLYVITGCRPSPEPVTGYSVTYSLCRMSVPSGEIEVVTQLETPFA
jgi:hypothetical protein